MGRVGEGFFVFLQEVESSSKPAHKA